MSLTYYLTIDGIVGDSVVDGHEGEFQISDYSFDVSALVSAASGGGGAVGETTFSPLTVDLDLNSGLTTLLRDIASGRHIRSIELQGVTSGGDTVYDLKLGDVLVTKYHDTNSGHDSLSFSYDAVSLTTTPVNSAGGLGTPVTVEWDLKTNREEATISDPVIPAGDPTGGGAHTYYLTIDGIVGDSVVDGHEGEFQISDYSFDVSALVSAASGGGGAAGETTVSPLTVDLDLNSGLTTLLRDIASGRHIRSIELQGVTTGRDTVYDLKLGDVIVTKYHDTNSGHDSLSFSYDAVSLTTTPVNSAGGLGTPVTVEWDLKTNREEATLSDPVIPAGDPTGGGAHTYYLTIDGIVGDSVVDGHEGEFQISDYSFDVSALVSAASGGGGAAGETTFSPLTVDLDLNSGLTTLLRDIASGRHIRSIELQGVTSGGDTVYDLKLGDVLVTKYHDTNSGHDSLSFSYDAVSLTTTPVNSAGGLGTPVTVEWDLKTNREEATISDPVIPAGDPTGGGAHTYYLTIDGIVGDSVVDGHEGEFQISDYSFDVSALVSAVSGGGGAAGETTFSPLTVDLDLNSGLTTLLRDIASGRHIRSIELQGVTSGGDTVYDLKLGDVIVTKYHDTNSGHDSLSFSYDAVSLTTTPVNSAGGLGTPVTVEWDLKTNREGGAIPDPLPNHPPTALDDSANATTGIGGAASGNVLSNDSDPDGDSLTVTGFSGAGAHGNLTLNTDGSYSYTVTNVIGATGSHLHDVFTYTESDGRGGTASANLDITLNRAPVATNDIAGLKTGATFVGNVLGNDADPDGDSLTVSGVSGGSVGQAVAGTYGTLVLNSDGSYSYVSNKSAQLPGHGLAQDTFTYTESDGHGGTAQAALTVSIIPNGQSYLAGTPGQTLTGGNGKGILDGSLGDQHLTRGSGADTLIGGPGDVLTGGHGPDPFVLGGACGRNEITDFQSPDTIELERSGFGSAADDLAHHAANDGHSNTIITDPHSPANVIILDHVSLSQLHTSDVVLISC